MVLQEAKPIVLYLRNNAYISFCEFYKNTTEVKTASELWNNVSRDGITVGEMLSGIQDKDLYVFWPP